MILMVLILLLGMGAYIYILVWDLVQIGMNPTQWQEGLSKFGADAGELLLKTQRTISASLEVMEGDGELTIIQRQFLTNQVYGSIAFNILLILGMMGLIRFFFRKARSSFWLWFKILLVSIIIIGLLQVVAAYALYEVIDYPYQGVVDLGLKWEIFINNMIESSVPQSMNMSVIT